MAPPSGTDSPKIPNQNAAMLSRVFSSEEIAQPSFQMRGVAGEVQRRNFGPCRTWAQPTAMFKEVFHARDNIGHAFHQIRDRPVGVFDGKVHFELIVAGITSAQRFCAVTPTGEAQLPVSPFQVSRWRGGRFAWARLEAVCIFRRLLSLDGVGRTIFSCSASFHN